jgi:hypothetical protein
LSTEEYDYLVTLALAQKELVRILQSRTALDERAAELKKTIEGLSSLIGGVADDPSANGTVGANLGGISAAIRVVLRESESGPLPPTSIRDELVKLGVNLSEYASPMTVVHNTLGRLERQGEVVKHADGYAWKWRPGEEPKRSEGTGKGDKPGMEQIDNPKTLSDAILLIIKATRERECITASDVVNRLARLQVLADPRSVESILTHLASGKNRRINAWNATDGSGLVGYEWLGNPRSQSERTNALKAVVNMDKVGLGKADRSLTFNEAILLTLQDSPGFVPVSEIKERLFTLGYRAAQPKMIAEMLNDLAKDGKISGAIGPNGVIGYGLKEETTKGLLGPAERFEQQTQVRRRSNAG